MKTFLLAALVALLPACGKKSSAPPVEPDNTAGTGDEPVGDPPAEEPAPTTAEECEAAGYQVVGDIGDGNVQCPAGTEEVSRIQYGIEGGVCCKTAEGAE
jgi:hypothetical protein